MVCVHCGSQTEVVNSRLQKKSNSVWRRRKCLDCQAVFTTQEVAQYEAAWAVQYKSGHLRPFSRDKLYLSLYRSCQHRPKAVLDAGGLTDTIINKLLTRAASGVLDNKTIAQVAQVALNRFDKAASVHYAAYHG